MRTLITDTILLIFILCIFPLHAQYSTISGKITDEKAQPLPYVTLQLTTPDSVFIQGTTTDEQGNYKLTEVGPGDYLLFLSSVGYEQKAYPFRQENKDRALPDIILKSSSVALQEVEVKAQSIVQLDDRMLVFPEKQQVRHSYTGYDLLDRLMIPGLDVDRRGGSVKNFAGTVTLYIDGRKADFREVQSLRPRDVEKVEYFEAPTGKYAMDVASINYITKKYTSGGYVSLDARQTIGYLQGDYNASMKINKGNTAFTVWGGHNMTRYGGSRTVSDETYTFPDQSITKHSETTDGLQRSNRQYAQAKVSNRTDRRTMEAKLGFARNANPGSWQTSQTVYSHRPDELLETRSAQDQTAIKPNMQLYGSFKIKDNQSLEASINSSYSNTVYQRNYNESMYHSYTHANEHQYDIKGNINYVLQFKHNQSLAVQLHHRHLNTATEYNGDHNQLSQVSSNESLLFLEYSIPIGKKVSLHIGPGLSSMLYSIDKNNSYFTLLPRLHFRSFFRPTNKQSLNLGFFIGNNTPWYHMLNSVEQNIDSFRVIRGNKDVEISKQYATDLTYGIQLGSLYLNAYASYNYAYDFPLSYHFIDDEKVVTSYRSDNKLHFLNTGIGGTWKITQSLHLNADGYYGLFSVKGGLPYKLNILAASIKANYYWKSLSVSVFFDTPSNSFNQSDMSKSRIPCNYGASINWSYRGLWIEVGTNSPFSRDLARRSYLDAFPTVYSYDKTIHDRTYQQTGWVKVAYNFDFGRKTTKDKDRVNTDIQSTILKAE